MKRRILDKLVSCRAGKISLVLVTDIETGSQWLVFKDQVYPEYEPQPGGLGTEVIDTARRYLETQRSSSMEVSGKRWIMRAFVPPPRMIVVGAVHIAQALLPMARIAGFRVHLIDPREAFGSNQRFPGVEVIHEWPDRALDILPIDSSSAVVTLSHDLKIDDPAIKAALASEAFYVGALGSRKTHASRLERLSASGVDTGALQRIHAPVGLPLGGNQPAEIAVAILAEIIEARYRH